MKKRKVLSMILALTILCAGLPTVSMQANSLDAKEAS